MKLLKINIFSVVMSLLCSNSVIEIIMREKEKGRERERESVCKHAKRKSTKTVVERSALYFLVLPLTAELNGTAQGSAV